MNIVTSVWNTEFEEHVGTWGREGKCDYMDEIQWNIMIEDIN